MTPITFNRGEISLQMSLTNIIFSYTKNSVLDFNVFGSCSVLVLNIKNHVFMFLFLFANMFSNNLRVLSSLSCKAKS